MNLTSQLSNESLIQTLVLSKKVIESKDTLVKWDEIEHSLTDYRLVIEIYEGVMTENFKLNEKLQYVEKTQQLVAPTEAEIKLNDELKKIKEEHVDQISIIQ